MADVSRPVGRSARARQGQLLVLGAIVLGLIFVGIALVLNSAIFAENLATRQTDGGSSDARTFRSAAVDGVADTIDDTNREGAGDPFTQLRDERYRPQVENISRRLANRESISGTAVGITPVTSRPGTQIVDADATSDITPRTGAVDWTMVDAAHVRAFELTVDPDDSSDVSDGVTFTLTPASGDAYTVTVHHGGGAVVAVSEVGSSQVRECAADGTIANVSLTGRPTVDGDYCSALAPVADTTGTYEVTVTAGDRATGTYRVVVDRTDGAAAAASLREQVDRANFGAACSDDTYAADPSASPHAVPAIYAGTVELRYESRQAASQATTRVVPAQAGNGLTTPRVASLSVDDNSGTDTALEVDWTVEDPNADLAEVTVTVMDLNDGDGRTETTTVSGASASGSLSFSDTGDGGDRYDIAVTVTDDASNDRTRAVRHTADDDASGCPP